MKQKIMKIIEYFKEIIFKIKDYDRIESDYIDILMYTTGGAMSKSNYLVSGCKNRIDEYQDEYYNSVFKDDILDILNNDGTLEDVRDYVNNLYVKEKGIMWEADITNNTSNKEMLNIDDADE